MANRVDIMADLNSEDDAGFVWTFLDEAKDPEVSRPGEVVVAGSRLAPAVREVLDLVEKPVGAVVHLRVLRNRCGALRLTSVPKIAHETQRPAEAGLAPSHRSDWGNN